MSLEGQTMTKGKPWVRSQIKQFLSLCMKKEVKIAKWIPSNKITCFSSPTRTYRELPARLTSITSLFPRGQHYPRVLTTAVFSLLPSSAARGSLRYKMVYLSATILHEGVRKVSLRPWKIAECHLEMITPHKFFRTLLLPRLGLFKFADKPVFDKPEETNHINELR